MASLLQLSQQARFPGVDPSCISTQVNHELTPKYTISLSPPFGMDSAFSSPGLRSPAGFLDPGLPTPDDVRQALDTLVAFTEQSSGAMDEEGHLLALKLFEKIHGVLPRRLYPLVQQDGEIASRKEHYMSAGY